jgi:DNA-directed RNA polymerase subunit M/transcription elongation factor TFIIS
MTTTASAAQAAQPAQAATPAQAVVAMPFYLPFRFTTEYKAYRCLAILNFDTALAWSTTYQQLDQAGKLERLVRIEQDVYQESERIARADLVIDPLEFRKIYDDIVLRICVNMDKTCSVGNHVFADRMAADEVENAASLTSKEIFPERYVAFEIASADDFMPRRTTTMYKCGRCHQRKTTVQSVQTRALDEASGTVVTCVNCHHTWYIG